MTAAPELLTITFTVIYLMTLLYILARRGIFRARWRWLAATLTTLAVAAAARLVPPDVLAETPFTPDLLATVGVMLVMLAFGGLLLTDITHPRRGPRLLRAHVGLALLWLVAFVGAALLIDPAYRGWQSWSESLNLPAAIILTGGFVILGLTLILSGLYHFYIAPMPEIGNRAAFWTITAAVLMIGVILVSSGTTALQLIGDIVLLTVTIGAIYAVRHYRLIDVRLNLFTGTRVTLVLFTTAAFAFGALYLIGAPRLRASETGMDIGTLLLMMGLALTVALAFIIVRYTVHDLFERLQPRNRANLAAATAQYSRSVATAATLEDVVNATTYTLNTVMGVRRSALTMINNTFRMPDAVELIVMEAGGSLEEPSYSGYIAKHSPIFRTLAIEKVPVGLFDIEYGPAYADASEDERAFFRRVNMRLFVPVVTEGRLIGLLACGPKSDDTPFYRHEVEMLMVIAQQVGTALRSARLIDDLQHLNDTMRSLNTRLQNAKTELEKLDSVKTDFVTIASHELRTPLAQIRGYTDIIDSLNDQGILDPNQTKQMVSSLRKSTERMEQLISAMLDVSQIDVKSMDLRFIRTTPEAIIRMAIEPLNESLEQRDLTIKRENLSGLPHIQADMQRLVQAFRNIILNAIKFTPDGGTITISAEVDEIAGQPEAVIFAIRDTGVGIRPKDLKLIFEKFYRGFDPQLHSTGVTKFMGAGPGLGLTIAQGIIKGHGGSIWAESEGFSHDDLPGATFYVRLPLNPPEGDRRVMPMSVDRSSDTDPKALPIDPDATKGAHNGSEHDTQTNPAVTGQEA